MSYINVKDPITPFKIIKSKLMGTEQNLSEYLDTESEFYEISLSSGNDPIKLLTGHDSLICPMIENEKITFIKKLNDGGASKMPIWIVSAGKQTFVVKIGTLDITTYKKSKGKISALGELAENFQKEEHIFENAIVMINGGDRSRMIKINDLLFIPNYAMLSKTAVNKYFKRSDNDKRISVPIGTLITRHDEGTGEFLMGILATKEALRGVAPHVLKISDLSICSKQRRQYIFMQQAHGDLNSLFKKNDKRDMGKVIFQILFTLEGLQRSMKFIHNDLHTGNVFYVNSSEILSNNEPINGETLQYILDDQFYDIKDDGIYPVIADFGFAQKFTEPMIVNESVMKNEFDSGNPNFYNSFFDMGTLLMWMAQNDCDEAIQVLKFIYKDFIKDIEDELDFRVLNVIDANDFMHRWEDDSMAYRPKTESLEEFKDITPAKILKECPLFDKYKLSIFFPSSSDYIKMGEII